MTPEKNKKTTNKKTPKPNKTETTAKNKTKYRALFLSNKYLKIAM